VDTNGFKFSETKTVCVHFCRLRKVHPDPVLLLNGTQIPVVEQAKFPSRTFRHRHQSLHQAQLLVLLLLMFFLLLAVNATLDTTNADPCSAHQLHSVYTAYRLNDTIHNTLMCDSASCHDFDFHNGSRLLRHTSGGCNTTSWVHCSQTYTKYGRYWEMTSWQCDLHQMSFNESCQSSGDEHSPQTTNTHSLQMKWTNKHHTTII